MKTLFLGSISRKLTFLVFVSVLPALAILLYTGNEQRHKAVLAAEQNVLLLTNSMAEVQQGITRSSRQILSTLAQLPAVRRLDIEACRQIFADVLKQNPGFHNIVLTDAAGQVLAAGRSFRPVSLADRRHVRRALETKGFAAGEYIVTRLGGQASVLPFAYPVLDRRGTPAGVLTTTVDLSRFTEFHQLTDLPPGSFVAATDYRGVRLFYYPPKQTNRLGRQIKAGSWEIARDAARPGSFVHTGSDGQRRIFAYHPLRLATGQQPYIYLWAGIPEQPTLAEADQIMTRNLLLMLLAAGLALLIAWLLGRQQLLQPIAQLVDLTRKFAEGELLPRSRYAERPDELGLLTRSFHEMVDELNLSQQAVRESEARFRLVMDSLDALVYVADMENHEILFINQFGKQIFGDVSGKICWQSLQQNQSGPCSFCTNDRLLDKTGQPGEACTWEIQNSINRHWYFIRDRAIRWLDGRIVRLEVATDISERKQIETSLAEERERLAVTLRSIDNGVIATDTEGRITLLNREAEQLTGWSVEAALGRPLDEVYRVQEDLSGRSCSPLARLESDRLVVDRCEQPLLTDRHGQQKRISQRISALTDRDGQRIGLVLVFSDITEQLRTEEELIKIKKLESIGVLAGGIAHDFNNILAAILGNIDLSLRDKQLSEKTCERLAQARTASFRARDLTQQLLTFAKGGQPIKETASLAEVVQESAEFVLRGDKVACRFDFPDDLWLVDIDKGQISQVIQNIILNASHAMPDGGSIEVSARNLEQAEQCCPALSCDRVVQLEICDSGIGIPKNIIDRIFDPYFTTKQQGSGLGLAITHSIINKHGGSISVDSTPGAGSCFRICLPVAEQAAPAEEETRETEPTTAPCRILVMDDEEVVRKVVAEMLQELGHEVLLSEAGEQAVECYRQALQSQRPIDLLILDLTIPGGLGGKDALAQILQLDPAAKAIVSSGYSNDPVMANYAEYGFKAAVAKPFRLDELLHAIQRLTS